MKIKLIKSLIFPIVLVALQLLTSCGKTNLPIYVKNGQLGVAPSNYENLDISDYVIPVNHANVIKLIESDSSFLLYLGNEYCASCHAFKPAFIEYIMTSRLLVYHYDNVVNGTGDFALLSNAYPDIFKTDFVTPSLYFFKAGELRTKQIGNARMFNIATLRPIMEGLSVITDIVSYHALDLVDDNWPKQTGVYLIYDRTNTRLTNFYNQSLFPYINEHKTSLIQLEVSLNSTMLSSLEPFFPSEVPTMFSLQSGNVLQTLTLEDVIDADALAWYMSQVS